MLVAYSNRTTIVVPCYTRGYPLREQGPPTGFLLFGTATYHWDMVYISLIHQLASAKKPGWLVVWNMFHFSIFGNSNPNWLIFFRGVGIPPTSWLLWIKQTQQSVAAAEDHLQARYFAAAQHERHCLERSVVPRLTVWVMHGLFRVEAKGFEELYLGTPKGHNFSLRRKNKLLGSQTEISVWGWSQAIFWFSGWFVWISTWFW